MQTIRRDINFGLFILIIATLVCFAAFTVYYQTAFRDLNYGYQSKIDDLDAVTKALTTRQAELNETTYELNIKRERETDLSQKYDTVRSLKEQLEDEKEQLEDDLESAQNQLSETKATLASTEIALSAKSAEAAELQSEVDSLQSDVDDLESNVDDLCDAISGLGGTNSICG